MPVTCSPGAFLDGNTSECQQCTDGTYQPQPSQVTILFESPVRHQVDNVGILFKYIKQYSNNKQEFIFSQSPNIQEPNIYFY